MEKNLNNGRSLNYYRSLNSKNMHLKCIFFLPINYQFVLHLLYYGFIIKIQFTIIWYIKLYIEGCRMYYFIENSYTRRLYEQIKNTSTEFVLIAKAEFDMATGSNIVIIDQDDLNFLASKKISTNQIIVLGESVEPYKCVSKYQSYRQIKAQISDSHFSKYLFTSDQNLDFGDIFLKELAHKLDVDYIISLNFSQTSNFSLYNWTNNQSIEIPKKIILDLISNLPDAFNLPESEIISFINTLALKGNLLILSYPLKGNLDKLLLSIAHKVFLVTSTFENKYSNQIRQYTKAELHLIPFEKADTNNQFETTISKIEKSILTHLTTL